MQKMAIVLRQNSMQPLVIFSSYKVTKFCLDLQNKHLKAKSIGSIYKINKDIKTIRAKIATMGIWIIWGKKGQLKKPLLSTVSFWRGAGGGWRSKSNRVPILSTLFQAPCTSASSQNLLPETSCPNAPHSHPSSEVSPPRAAPSPTCPSRTTSNTTSSSSEALHYFLQSENNI